MYEEIIDNKKDTYHDTYFGGVKFMGEEVLYCDDNKPIWENELLWYNL